MTLLCRDHGSACTVHAHRCGWSSYPSPAVPAGAHSRQQQSHPPPLVLDHSTPTRRISYGRRRPAACCCDGVGGGPLGSSVIRSCWRAHVYVCAPGHTRTRVQGGPTTSSALHPAWHLELGPHHGLQGGCNIPRNERRQPLPLQHHPGTRQEVAYYLFAGWLAPDSGATVQRRGSDGNGNGSDPCTAFAVKPNIASLPRPACIAMHAAAAGGRTPLLTHRSIAQQHPACTAAPATAAYPPRRRTLYWPHCCAVAPPRQQQRGVDGTGFRRTSPHCLKPAVPAPRTSGTLLRPSQGMQGRTAALSAPLPLGQARCRQAQSPPTVGRWRMPGACCLHGRRGVWRRGGGVLVAGQQGEGMVGRLPGSRPMRCMRVRYVAALEGHPIGCRL